MDYKRTILHVDDDPQITRIVAERLKRLGYEVTSLNDPRQAMKELNRSHQRLVLLDVEMGHVKEALNLIFHPGFSTAEKVSDVSGRGVGMDVVRTTLAEHDGEVTVESQVGVGTTLRLDIPLRQATLVIDGLMVSEDGEQFVIPFDNLKEMFELAPEEFQSAYGRRVVTIRENVYDAIRLSEILGLPSADASEMEKETAILVHSKECTFCLLVDHVLGHRQVVVTGLKEVLPNADKIAGVAQLGGGRLALVLNVAEVVKCLGSNA